MGTYWYPVYGWLEGATQCREQFTLHQMTQDWSYRPIPSSNCIVNFSQTRVLIDQAAALFQSGICLINQAGAWFYHGGGMIDQAAAWFWSGSDLINQAAAWFDQAATWPIRQRPDFDQAAAWPIRQPPDFRIFWFTTVYLAVIQQIRRLFKVKRGPEKF